VHLQFVLVAKSPEVVTQGTGDTLFKCRIADSTGEMGAIFHDELGLSMKVRAAALKQKSTRTQRMLQNIARRVRVRVCVRVRVRVSVSVCVCAYSDDNKFIKCM
jgi:hypothetical protein